MIAPDATAALADIAPTLEPLGFTEIEARAYVALLARPGQTGYALAKAIGKGQPSVYAALAGLEAKGAVAPTDAGSRTYAAAPVEELIATLRRRQDARLDHAAEALRRVNAADGGETVSRLDSADQVFAKARSLLQGATETVLFELTSGPAQALRAEVAETVARGVKASGMVLREEDVIPGADCIVSPVGARVAAIWPVDLLILIVDGRQGLIAGLGEAGKAQALWTDSLFLSVILHNAITSDVLLHQSMKPDWIGPNLTLFGGHPPGFRDFLSLA